MTTARFRLTHQQRHLRKQTDRRAEHKLPSIHHHLQYSMSILRQSLRSQLAGPSRSNVSFLIRPLIASVAPFHTSTPARSLQNIFETPERPSLAITKFNDKGYHLTDGLVIPGGVVFVGGQVMLWDVDPPIGNGSGKGGLEAAWKGWGKERFKVFESVSPRPGEYVSRSRWSTS